MNEGLDNSKEPEGKEKVELPAVYYNGEVFTDLWHKGAIEKCLQKFPEMDWGLLEEGYMTNRGRFVTRVEADELEVADSDER